jgi:hypothetical protein
MENAIWSMHFARQIAQRLGYGPPDAPPGALGIDLGAEPERIIQEMTESFRYLPPEQINLALNYAAFLRAHAIDACHPAQRPFQMAEKLREVCDLTFFLRTRYGTSEPADEKDYWTDEDRREFQEAAWRRLEEEDPWPDDDYPLEEQGNAQTG